MMDIKERNQLFEKLEDRFGINGQVVQTFEEFAECQKELSKWIRGKADMADLAEEIADVEIMLEQMKYFLELDDFVEAFKESKFQRIKERYGGTV